jgi:S-DNA-T family DNA segregation ATPase FtsK/SpoIIIE
VAARPARHPLRDAPRRRDGIRGRLAQGLTSEGLHFLTALPRLDGSSDAGDLASATKAIAEEVRTFWPGQAAAPVRLLPTRLMLAELPAPENDPMKMVIGYDEQRLLPVWHDFAVTPHLMVFGDNETGKTNMLRMVIENVRKRYAPGQAKILLGDSRRDLDTAVNDDYRIGYAITSDSLHELVTKAAVSMGRRVPGEDVAPDRLRSRDWWTGPELFLVVDDYELLARPMGMGSALDPMLPLLAQGVHIGLHVIIARSTSGAMRAMVDPVLRRLWELGTPGLVYAYPKEEGKFLGEAAPRKMPPGRAQLVTRRGVRLVQTGLVGDDQLRETSMVAQTIGGTR